jgi:hypothetical protein
MKTPFAPLLLIAPAVTLLVAAAPTSAQVVTSSSVTERIVAPETRWFYSYQTWDAGTSSVTWYPAYTSSWPTYGSYHYGAYWPSLASGYYAGGYSYYVSGYYPWTFLSSPRPAAWFGWTVPFRPGFWLPPYYWFGWYPYWYPYVSAGYLYPYYYFLGGLFGWPLVIPYITPIVPLPHSIYAVTPTRVLADVATLYGRARSDYRDGRLAAALDSINRAVEQETQDARLWYMKALVERRLGRTDAAESSAQHGAAVELLNRPSASEMGAALEFVQGAERQWLRGPERLAMTLEQARQIVSTRASSAKGVEEVAARPPSRR